MLKSKLQFAEDALVSCMRLLPYGGEAAATFIEKIRARKEQALLQEKLGRIEDGLSNIERRMRDVVCDEMQNALSGLARIEVSVADFTKHINTLTEFQQHGWSPTLFQGLVQRSVHWDALCKNPSHYGTILNDNKAVDSAKLPVLIDCDDKTRILELTPIALHALLTRQQGELLKPKIVATADVWGLVKGKQPSRTVYRDLADCYDRLGKVSMRDRFLILAADVALQTGQAAEAERLRQRLLQGSPHHMLRPYNSFAEATAASDVQTYLRDLRANYPLDVAKQLLDSSESV